MEGDQNESDNDYSWETPRKKLNTSLDTMGISAVHLHGVAPNSWASTAKNKLDRAVEVLKTSWDAYVVSTDQLASSESVNVILKLNKRHQSLIVCTIWWKRSWLPLRTLKRYRFWHLHQIHGPRRYRAEHFNVSEYLVRTASELKMVKGIFVKPVQEQGKVISQNTIDLVLSMYEDDEFSCQMPGGKDYVGIAKGIHKQKNLVLCNLREMDAAFKEKYLMLSLEFPNFPHFDQNGVN